MALTPAKSAEQDERLDEVVTAYLKTLEEGTTPDRQAWLEAHPELAAELTDFFADQDALEKLAGQFRQATQVLAAQQPPLPAGMQVGGYEILEQIGAGGMGVVYKARQKSPGRLVALKMIRAGRLASAAEVRRFRNEAETVAGLDHPNILPIYEVGEQDGLYFSMKLMENGSLARAVATGAWCGASKDEQRRSAELVAIVARAVDHAHQRGVLHRDLKPGNILFDADGRQYVADFGLAKRTEADGSLTESGAFVGTPSFMAPEQTLGRKGLVTTATDVYGLGAILYVLLTGKPPFQGDSLLDTLAQVRGRQPERPSASNRQVNRDLETICLKCLEKEPAQRYGSAAALADDLERWQAGQPILARPLGQAERLRRWCQRNPVVAALLAALALLILAATIGQSVTIALLLNQQEKTEDQARDTKAALRQAQEQRTLAQESASAARLQLYAFRINQAWRSWQESRVAEAIELLALEVPAGGQDDLRGFEWHYLSRLCRGQREARLTLRGHTDEVYCAVFSPDGKLVASASKDKTVRLWDPATGQPRGILKGHTDEVNEVAFSPDGQTLASCGDDGRVLLWDVATARKRVELANFAREVTSVAFAPNGKTLYAALIDGSVCSCELPSGRQGAPVRLCQERICQITVSSDGKVLAAAASIGFILDLANKKLREVHLPVGGGSRGVALARHEPLFATTARHAVELWDYGKRDPGADHNPGRAHQGSGIRGVLAR